MGYLTSYCYIISVMFTIFLFSYCAWILLNILWKIKLKIIFQLTFPWFKSKVIQNHYSKKALLSKWRRLWCFYNAQKVFKHQSLNKRNIHNKPCFWRKLIFFVRSWLQLKSKNQNLKMSQLNNSLAQHLIFKNYKN